MGKDRLHIVSSRLEQFLDHLTDKTQNDAKEGLTDSAKLSEVVVRDLMNVLYDFTLQEEEKPNAAGFDLCDPESGILVQVTRKLTNEKIKECLRTTAGRITKEPELENAKLYIVFLTMKQDKVNELRKKTADKLLNKKLKAKGFQFEANNLLCLRTFVNFLIRAKRPDGKLLEPKHVEAIEKLLEVYDPKPVTPVPQINLPLPRSLGAKAFLGRDKELQELAQAVEEHINPTEIWGLGGLGKTELAIRFGARYKDKGGVYWVTFVDNFRKTITEKIAAGISELLECGLNPDAKYDEVMKCLRRCPSNDLLIIDNVEWDAVTSDPEYDQDGPYYALCDLPMHLVLTARTKKEDGGLEIGQMDKEVLYKIFDLHKVEIEKQDKDALIEAVEGHTMMVDLIARTLSIGDYDGITPQLILDELKKNTLVRGNLPQVPTKHNRAMTEKEIGAHISTLFSLRGNTETGEYILRCATLLPQDGMKRELFQDALMLPQKSFGQEMQKLKKRGWLREKARIITIHPVVRMACRDKLQPTEESCAKFLESLWETYESLWQQDESIWEQHREQKSNEIFQVIACFQNAVDLPGDTAIWKNRGDILLKKTLGAVDKSKGNPEQLEITNGNAVSIQGLVHSDQVPGSPYTDRVDLESSYLKSQEIDNQDSIELSRKNQKMQIEQLRHYLVEHGNDSSARVVEEIIVKLEWALMAAEGEQMDKSRLKNIPIRSMYDPPLKN